MEFRPCIDIHHGKVKQLVGSSLRDDEANEQPTVNFVAEQDAAYYATLYKEHQLKGGHVIMLDRSDSPHYPATLAAARKALEAYPGGLQIGGGINPDNAQSFLEAGASHVIVTSYVFQEGQINYQNLEKLRKAVGKEKIVLDLSCRAVGVAALGDPPLAAPRHRYFIVTDRWQRFTEEEVSAKNLQNLEQYCAEFLIHAVDVEGKAAGIDEKLINILAEYKGVPLTYAGGARDLADLAKLRELTSDRLNVTIGSALDIFGGSLKLADVLEFCQKNQ
jgi:phosphoribosylformimino-5-aminoimidazole carboxamide ribotide isomerase